MKGNREGRKKGVKKEGGLREGRRNEQTKGSERETETGRE